MSVLIKGMEMPSRCGECLLAKLSPTGESLICDYMLSRVSWDERPFDCPLVPVPSHGRLIDADALIAAHEQVCSRSMKFNLDLTPTIIPADTAEEDE